MVRRAERPQITKPKDWIDPLRGLDATQHSTSRYSRGLGITECSRFLVGKSPFPMLGIGCLYKFASRADPVSSFGFIVSPHPLQATRDQAMYRVTRTSQDSFATSAAIRLSADPRAWRSHLNDSGTTSITRHPN